MQQSHSHIHNSAHIHDIGAAFPPGGAHDDHEPAIGSLGDGDGLESHWIDLGGEG